MGGELEELGELEGEGVGIVLFTEVEDEFGLGSLLVGGGHEVGDEGFEGGGVGAEDGGELLLLMVLEVGGLGGHGGES